MRERVPHYLIDTSVAVKWFVERNEANVAEARLLREAHLRGRCALHAPELLAFEIANTLAIGHGRESQQVHEALEAFQLVAINVSPLEWATLGRSIEVATSLRVTVYDAYFLALAVAYGIPLITADDAFLRRIGPHPNAIPLRDLDLRVDLA